MHGRNAKKAKGKGNRGGMGMAGTGKKAGHKASFLNRYMKDYFGKQGITSRKTARFKGSWINVGDIQSMGVKELVFQGKILGDGEIKNAVTVKAESFSKQAKEKIEKARGKAVLLQKKKEEKSKES